MTKDELAKLAAQIVMAECAGQKAANEALDDGGSANLDHVCLVLPRVRESTLRSVGINGWRGNRGVVHLNAPFNGQGNRRYLGVQAMYEYMRAQGINCYIHYQID